MLDDEKNGNYHSAIDAGRKGGARKSSGGRAHVVIDVAAEDRAGFDSAEEEVMGEQTKHGAVMEVDGASLHVRRSGYGEKDGSGYFVFDENDVQWLPHDEREGSYLKVKLARSEMIELRDFLLREYPLVECAARRQGTAGGNASADCDWSRCGCDPYAQKVIDAIEEAG